MSEQGSEPARAAIAEAIDTQLADGEPPETAETLDRLLEEGYTRNEAYRLIGCAIADEMFQIMMHQREFDDARYIRLLQNLPRLSWE